MRLQANLLGHGVGVSAVKDGVFLGDNAFFIQIQQAVIHGEHALAAGGLDYRVDLVDLGFPDHIADGAVDNHDFKSSDHLAILGGNQLL